MFLVIILFVFTQCKSVPDITGFDSGRWKEDVNGCEGTRMKLAGDLELERQKLKGVAESDLVKMLGNPNQVQVMERQQKQYIYWIQNPAQCPGANLEYRELRIRFSAIGRVTETLFN